jgi:hypothetical protein
VLAFLSRGIFLMKISIFPWALVVALFAFAANAQNLHRLNGIVTGFGDLKRDNIVDGAIVLQSLSSEDLFNLQMDQFMGPPEKMTVGGLFSADVPSNMYFPKQTERWGILPVTFKKESFGLYVTPGDKREVYAAWFQLPWDKLVKMGQNGGLATDLLPDFKIQKFGVYGERDWSTFNSPVNLAFNANLATGPRYTWKRSALAEGQMDAITMFQGTRTGRWVFANILGNPPASGSVQGVSVLENNYKVIFMRTHAQGKDVESAEGYIRTVTREVTSNINALPAPLDAKLVSADTITWTPIPTPGWMSLVISPKKQETRLFVIPNFFGGVFSRLSQQFQMWFDATLGQIKTGLTNATLSQNSVVMTFVGTAFEVQMPQPEEDNSEFIDAASEIRMKKLQ